MDGNDTHGFGGLNFQTFKFLDIHVSYQHKCIIPIFCKISFMGNTFFSTKEASEITGCTPRQLQYWREKGVIVPEVNASGTGRSIYYSRSQLLELAVMAYWLSIGLTFEVASSALQELKAQPLEIDNPLAQKRFMLHWDEVKRELRLAEFEREKAIAFLDSGQPIIPVWLDRLSQQLAQNL